MAERVVDLRLPPVPDREAPIYIVTVRISIETGIIRLTSTVLYPTVVLADMDWKSETRSLSPTGIASNESSQKNRCSGPHNANSPVMLSITFDVNMMR